MLPPRSSQDMASYHDSNGFKVFKPICLILQFLGLRCPSNSKSGWRQKISNARRIVPCFFLLYNFIFVCNLINKLRFDRTLNIGVALSVGFVIFLITSSIGIIFLIRWDIIGVLRQLPILISFATDQTGVKAAEKRMKIRITVHFIACVFLVVVEGFFQMTTTFGYPHLGYWSSGDNRLTAIMFGLRFLDYFNPLLVMYACASWCMVASFVTLCMVTIYEEYENFNLKLRKHQNWTVEAVRKYSITYFRLAKAVEHLDSSFATALFIMLSADIANFILLIYSLVKGCCDQPIMGYVFIGITTFFLILRFLAFTLAPAKVYEAARQSAGIIAQALDCDDVAKDGELYRAASWFVQKVNCQPPGISLGGFCIITKPLLLTITSVVVTYLILLVQMSQGIPDNTSVMQNETTIAAEILVDSL